MLPALRFFAVREGNCFVRGAFGILEPDPKQALPIPEESIDFILVPGLAFDLAGIVWGGAKVIMTAFCLALVRCAVASPIQATYIRPCPPGHGT